MPSVSTFQHIMLSIILMVLLGSANSQAATDKLVLKNEQTTVSFGDCGVMFTDSYADSLTWEQVYSRSSDHFTANKEFDIFEKVQWVKIPLVNQSNTTLWYYAFLYHNIDFAESYLIDSSGHLIDASKSGALVAVQDRPFQEFQWNHTIIPVEIPVGSTTLLVRLESIRNYTLEHRKIRKLSLVGKDRFHAIFERSEYIDGVFSGYYMVLILISLLLYFSDRQAIYLHTSILVLVGALYSFYTDGHFFKLLIPNYPAWSIYLENILGMIPVSLATWTVVDYLQIPKVAPKVARTSRIMAVVLSMMALAGLFSIYFYNIWAAFTSVCLVNMVYLIYRSIKAKVPQALYFAFAYGNIAFFLVFGFLFHYFNIVEYEVVNKYFQAHTTAALYCTSLMIGVFHHYIRVRNERHQKQLESERALSKAEADRLQLIEKQNVILEEKVKKRTEEILEKNKQLEKLDQMKSRFFANISHEFRTPLTLIVGPAKDMIKESENNPKAKQDLETILSNADQLLNLINQLLDLAKSENEKLNIDLQRTDIRQFIQNQIRPFLSLSNSKNIQIITSDVDDIMVTMDIAKMQRVFDNIFFNALKFSKEDTKITINAYQDGDQFHLEIIDQGPGIPAGEEERVFERFYQLNSSEIAQGTGIGLALAKVYVNLHGGTIKVAKNHPQGARFIVSFPNDVKDSKTRIIALTPPSTPKLNIGSDAPIFEPPTRLDEKKTNLLIVEDEPLLRAYIKSCFKDDYQVFEAENGSLGLEMARNLIPDIVVSDVMMPKMDGMSMTHALKTDMITSHIPVILLTAKAGVENKVEGLDYGADDYLTKPFDSDELLARVRTIIHNRQILKEKYSNSLTDDSPIQLPAIEQKFLDLVNEEIDLNLTDEYYDIAQLSQNLKLNRTTLFRKLKAITNESPNIYLRNYRLRKAKNLMTIGQLNVSELANHVGFSSTSYFSRAFKDYFGVAPSEVKN